MTSDETQKSLDELAFCGVSRGYGADHYGDEAIALFSDSFSDAIQRVRSRGLDILLVTGNADSPTNLNKE